MIDKKTSFYTIDIGNTRTKVGCFQNDVLKSVNTLDHTELEYFLIETVQNEYSIISSVEKSSFLDGITNKWRPTIMLSSTIDLPISLEQYNSLDTLGVDRIANVVASHFYSKKNAPSLVIDIGTCIKYDVIDAKSNYLGGAISPGVQMRFSSMHQFTARLPLITDYEFNSLIGNSTKQSMQSGVLNGIKAELNGIISAYKEKFSGISIFLTGGDLKLFDKALKNDIFVDQNLTLKGLYLILKHHVQK